MIRVNGEELSLAGKTLLDFLKEASYDPTRIAVERNGDIVPKRAYAETILEDGDLIEVVSFVGGG
ncbi:MAG: sulfur carrier protein ThiS [Coriobacteriia bacterium]|nr:sulfur carrier protein ThiS [Coriobacteriia bacterium]